MDEEFTLIVSDWADCHEAIHEECTGRLTVKVVVDPDVKAWLEFACMGCGQHWTVDIAFDMGASVPRVTP